MNSYKVYLAPLEGLADGPMRKILCAHGGYDLCFSEFIRVSDLPVAPKILIREVPEFLNDCRTADGTDVRIQFLGDDPQLMAKSAQNAYKLGARSVDINFGCPSRFVHHSGSMLLKEPELLHTIVSTVREGLDPACSLSVKIRLGFASKDEAPEIVKAIAVDGVSEITIHCRTRKDLYRDDALDWSRIAPLHELAPGIRLIANGNINSFEDAVECQRVTLCDSFMCGRGAFPTPNLGHVIKGEAKPYSVAQIIKTAAEVLEEFSKTDRPDKIVMDRTKQFLGYARVHRKELIPFFKVFCQCTNTTDGLKLLEEQLRFEENENGN